jgi:GPH family glycoside/pentoside/hexuronide:cation symporter
MIEKIKTFLSDIKRYWKTPKANSYVGYREIAAFSVGGMGVKSVQSLISHLTLAPTCLLIASVYGLSPRHIMILFIITNIIGILKTPFVSMLVDNTHTVMGKFRPYLLWAGVPTVLSIIVLAWGIPLDASPTVKIVLIGVFINILSIAQPLYNNAYMGISQVITPNSGERTNILSFSEFLGNLGPSIVQFLLPTLAGLFFGKDGMLDIRTYRVFLPLFGIVGFVLGIMVMTQTRERVIEAEDTNEKKEHMSFAQGFKYICKNRYFWIVTISKFFDGFKGVLTLLLAWVCTYQLQNSAMQGIVQTIVSVGFTPGIILAPLIIKKLGSKYGAFTAHIMNCLAAVVMLFTFKKGFIFFAISLFLYNFASGPQYIMQTSILSDGFDHQQNRDGVRIEGFAQNFQLMISTLGSILSTVVFTFIYESNGLIADPNTGLTDYSVLTDASIREPIISSVIMVVIVASFLAAVPYLFCNLSHKDMEDIRISLEKKKFIKENSLENLSVSEQDERYNEHRKETASSNH